MRLSASKRKKNCSRLSRLSCGSSNLHCTAALTPDLYVLLKSSAGCFLRFPTVNSTIKRQPQTLSPPHTRGAGAHAPCSIFIRRHVTPQARSTSLSFFSKPTCLRRSSLFNACHCSAARSFALRLLGYRGTGRISGEEFLY